MKKRNQSFILISITVLFSCANVKKEAPKKETDSIIKVVNPTQVSKMENLSLDTSKAKTPNDILSGIDYSFSNDSLCETISIQEISNNKKLKIPEKLRFTLILRDKQHKYDDKIFEGIARLSSSEESFSDNLDKDGGDYFAADYNFEQTDYKIKIRLDIQSFEACVVLITTSQSDMVLGGYNTYLKKFPSDGVMKKGKCK